MKPIKIKGKVIEMDFEQCYEQFAGFRVLMRKRWDGIRLEREDLEQEIAVAFFKAYKKYDIDQQCDFITWVYRIVNTHLKQVLRDSNASNRKVHYYTSSLNTNVSNCENAVEKINTIKSKEDFTKIVEIKDIFERLDETIKSVIYLQLKGYSQIQIGKILGYSQAKVSREKLKFKRALEEVV
jgi:RNA polymerase sigma factor (sigma-70 family)